MERTTAAQNRSEQEIAGYRDVLGTIHANAADFSFTANVMLQLHRDLYQFLPGEDGYWKRADNEIVETGPDGIQRVRFRPVSSATPDGLNASAPDPAPAGGELGNVPNKWGTNR